MRRLADDLGASDLGRSGLAGLWALLAVSWVFCLPVAAETHSDMQGESSPRWIETTHGVEHGFMREIALGHLGSGPAIVAIGPDDTVWTALARVGAVARWSNERLELFPLGKDSRPVGIAVGTAANGYPGELWIAASFDNKLIRFNPVSGARQDFLIEGETSWPFNMAIHPDGGIWFTQRASGRLGRLEPETGVIEHFEPPTPSGGPAGMAIDAKSGRVWFTESYADRVAYFDPATSTIEEIVLGDASTGLVTGPAGLAVDGEGGVWVAKLEGVLAHVPRDAKGPEDVELIQLPPEARRPAGVVVSGDGTVWAGALDGNMMVRYLPSERRITLFPIPTGAPDLEPSQPPFAKTSRPFGIATDSRGNLWFSQQYTGQLAVLDTAGPELAVLWPSPKKPIQGASTLVTLRASDRVAGLERVSMWVDDRPVERGPAGRLDLSELTPGPHRLTVEAVDRAGFSSRVERPFNYRPDHLALMEGLEGWRPETAEDQSLRQNLLKIAGRIPRDRRTGLRRLEELLRSADAPGLPRESLLRQIELQQTVGSATLEVAVLDHPPYFKPRRIRLAPGDTVTFSYRPGTEGHGLSKATHQIRVDQAGADTVDTSPKLRAGESFSSTFERAGTFHIYDLRTGASGAGGSSSAAESSGPGGSAAEAAAQMIIEVIP